MSRVVLDRETLNKLRQPGERVEVCDESGNILGYFSPKADRSVYENVVVPFTEEELQRVRGGRWRTYARGNPRRLGEGIVKFTVIWKPEAEREISHDLDECFRSGGHLRGFQSDRRHASI